MPIDTSIAGFDNTAVTSPSATSFEGCLALCNTDDCAFATWNYDTAICTLNKPIGPMVA